MKADGLFVCFFCLPNLLSAYIQFILQHKPCVGDGALDVPLLVCLSNSTLSAQRSAYFFKTLYGTTFPHTARLHKFMNNQTLPLRAGCRGRQPLHLVQTNSLCRKIAPLFADFTLCYGIEKAVQSFVLRHRFDFAFSLFFFYCFSAPLGRLTPIEALPQAPTGLCPVPTMGFTP